jgi:hypothetical protein
VWTLPVCWTGEHYFEGHVKFMDFIVQQLTA